MALLYTAAALASFLVGLLLGLLGYPGFYVLPWFMIAVAVVASVHGLPWGLLASALSASALALFPQFSGVALALLLLSALLAHQVGESLRRAHRQAQSLARLGRLLASALEALPQVEDGEALLKSLPERLFALGEGGHVAVWVPQGRGFRRLASHPPMSLDWIPGTGVVGRAFREGQPIHIPDVRKEPHYLSDPLIPPLAELALPLREQGEAVAVLNLERQRPFLPEEVEGLTRFAQAVSLQLSRLADLKERRILAELAEGLARAETLEEAAEEALALLVTSLGLESGTLWEVRGARMQALASHGVREASLLQVLEEGLPFGVGLAWRVYETGSPFFTAHYAEESQGVPALKALGWRTFAALPVPSPGAPRSRRVLVLGQREARPWRRAEVDLLLSACRTLGLGLERLTGRARHQAVNRLFLDLLEKPLEALYPEVLEVAVRHVPGAEAGSLLVLEGGVYRFRAALGYDLEGLEGVTFGLEAQLLWYGRGKEEALRGEPRVLSAAEHPLAEISHRTAPPEVIDRAGRAKEIQANLCLPIPHKGQVLAYLNLDNLHDPRAFGEDSLRAARFFAAPIATLLHQSWTHKLLEEAALTDPLTGLPNRRAFDGAFLEELKRAERYGYPLSLAVLDLRFFKKLNDRLGHAVGDLALRRVAEALLEERRNGDKIFRWGGDEFAALFPHTGKEGAVKAALRYAEAIGKLCFDGLCLGVNIGLATFPADGKTPDELLSVADTRMYQAKAQGVTVLA